MCRYIPGKNGKWKILLSFVDDCDKWQNEDVNDTPTEFFFLPTFIGKLASEGPDANHRNIHIFHF